MAQPATTGIHPQVYAHVRTEAVAGDSPIDAAVPFWITACVRLCPPQRRDGTAVSPALANAVIPAVQALLADRLRTTATAAAPLDRDRIARRAGLDARKAGWLFDYLQRIMFLRIHRHYATPGRGRTVDTFTVYTQPPLNYLGPRTHADLERALDEHPTSGRTVAMFLGEPAGQPEGAETGTVTTDQGAESGTFTADQRTESGTLVSTPAGQPEGTETGTFTADQRTESGTLVSTPAGQPEGTGSGTFLQIDRSTIEESRSIEPVPGGTAPPPATGHPADEAAVRELVRRLPWAQWAARRNPAWRLSPLDADAVQAAIRDAMTTAGITLATAAAIGQAALGEARANPVGYVTDAYRTHLPRRLRALAAEPLSADPLPLPDTATPPAEGPTPTTGPDRSQPATPWCGDCQAPDYRWVEVTNDQQARCPRCHPGRPPTDRRAPA